jgi:hypothetical protein
MEENPREKEKKENKEEKSVKKKKLKLNSKTSRISLKIENYSTLLLSLSLIVLYHLLAFPSLSGKTRPS